MDSWKIDRNFNRGTGWSYCGSIVIENDGYFIRCENGEVYAWMDDGSLS